MTFQKFRVCAELRVRVCKKAKVISEKEVKHGRFQEKEGLSENKIV